MAVLALQSVISGSRASAAGPSGSRSTAVSREVLLRQPSTRRSMKNIAQLLTRGAGQPGIHDEAQSLFPVFRQVQVERELREIGDRSVVLNEHGLGFDGIRFKAPEGSILWFYWEFGLPRKSFERWYIMPRSGRMTGFTKAGKMGRPRGVPQKVAEEYSWIGQPHGGQHFVGGQEYIIWFHFSDDAPQRLYYSITMCTE